VAKRSEEANPGSKKALEEQLQELRVQQKIERSFITGLEKLDLEVLTERNAKLMHENGKIQEELMTLVKKKSNDYEALSKGQSDQRQLLEELVKTNEYDNGCPRQFIVVPVDQDHWLFGKWSSTLKNFGLVKFHVIFLCAHDMTPCYLPGKNKCYELSMPSEAAMKFKPAVRASIQMMKIVNLAVGALSPQLANVLKLVEVPKGFLDKFGEAEANKLKWDIILEKMREDDDEVFTDEASGQAYRILSDHVQKLDPKLGKLGMEIVKPKDIPSQIK